MVISRWLRNIFLFTRDHAKILIVHKIEGVHSPIISFYLGVPVNTAMQDPAFQTGFMQVPVEVVTSQDTRPNHTRPRRQRY